MELIYVKKGCGLITVNLKPYIAEAGSIVVVLPGELHSIERHTAERMEYENIIFSLSLLDTLENDWCHENFFAPLLQGSLMLPVLLSPGTALHDRAALFLDAADNACEERRNGYALSVKGQLFLFCFALFDSKKENTEAVPSPGAARMKTVISWIGEHYTESLSVAAAAEASGYSSSHFMRFFKKYMGQTFISYLLDYRLTAALRLLRDTQEPVGSIALSCGFDNISYFCRTFRKKYGQSPHKMRISG
jgi:AraC-like DNA-binding protein